MINHGSPGLHIRLTSSVGLKGLRWSQYGTRKTSFTVTYKSEAVKTKVKNTAADCSEGQFRKLLILQNSMLETKLLLTLLLGLFWKQFAEMKDERHYRTKTWWGCGNAYLLTVKRTWCDCARVSTSVKAMTTNDTPVELMSYIYRCDDFSFNADLYVLNILRNLLSIFYKTTNSKLRS